MIIKCKICGGNLEIIENSEVAVCEYCGTRQTLPKLSDEKRLNLYERANHFRRNNEYDKAMGIYEMILNEDGTDAEAYWSLVLCKYGVEYVEDPSTRKRIPTCNRTLNTSVMADEDYKAAIRNAGSMSRDIYEEEARKIDQIQKEILSISAREEAYDIFICYKESDERGRRTRDSVLAQDIYLQLTKEGYRVFFARVSLEDKIGTAYEPYIYSALSTAKIMILVGTEKEYFNAVWVKNEWSRFLHMMREKPEKILIPAYRDMDPYDLPEELLYLQAQDMGKLGFMQDLLHGIGKILKKDKQSNESSALSSNMGRDNMPISVDNLLLRIEAFLQDGNIDMAQEYCDKVLDIKIDEPRVYMAQLRIHAYKRYGGNVRSEDTLFSIPENIGKNSLFLNALKYADGEVRDKLLDLRERNKTYCYENVIKPRILEGTVPEQVYIDLIKEFSDEPGETKWELFLEYIKTLKKQADMSYLLGQITGDRGKAQKQYDDAKSQCENSYALIDIYEADLLKRRAVVISYWVVVVLIFFVTGIVLEFNNLGLQKVCLALCWIMLILAIVKTRSNKESTRLKMEIKREQGTICSMEQCMENAQKGMAAAEVTIRNRKAARDQVSEGVLSLRSQIETVFAKEASEGRAIDGEDNKVSNSLNEEVYHIGQMAFVCKNCGWVRMDKEKPCRCFKCNASAASIEKKKYTDNGWA